jgi:DNA-directed RNA polymerase specialized sigma24 family protein
MAKTLDFLLGKRANDPCGRYSDHRLLFEGLEREEPEAIRCLYSKVSGVIYQLGKNAKLGEEDIEELIGDCITIGLQKIRSGKFVFQGYAPATFIIEIAKNRAQNFKRKMIRHHTEELDPTIEQLEEEEYGAMEWVEVLEKVLAQLEPNCQKLIQLKYLDGRRDKDVIAENLTQYTTVDALKNHRSRCLKKLTDLARTAFPKKGD